MKQYILLQTYTGLSTFFYEATSTGRKLSLDEVLELGFTNQNELKRNKCSDYIVEWYEIKAGDQIAIVFQDDENNGNWTFTVPEAGLPQPPVRLDDERVGQLFHEYLKEHCQCTEESDSP